VGYRDDNELMFVNQTGKVVSKVQSSSSESSSPSSSQGRRGRNRSQSVETARTQSSFSDNSREAFPWLKQTSSSLGQDPDSVEDAAVSRLMDKYVIYPCTESSSPGFLEHLPSLFHDVNVSGRFALRWAVEAAALADSSRSGDGEEAAARALDYYSRSLEALGQSLSEKDKVPDDYDLMTVVMLDIFEVRSLACARAFGDVDIDESDLVPSTR
jgi:hypothetical protein